MEVNATTLKKVLYMARLAPTAEEKTRLHKDLNNMVDWVKQLSQVDTTDVEPLASMSHEVNRLREDTPQVPLPYEKALANAPVRSSHYFQVPLVKA